MNARALAVADLDTLAAGEDLSSPVARTERPSTRPSPATSTGAGTPVPIAPPTGFAVGLRRLRPALLSTGFGLTVLFLWEFLVRITDYPAAILPAPTVVLGTMVDNAGLLLANIPATAGVALGGFLIATVGGVAISVAMTWSLYLKEALFPNIIAFQIVPKVAWAPMFVLWLGIETESRLGFATFISIFPIIISMTTGLQNTDPSMLRLCRSLTASKWQMLIHVRFPYALPFLFSAMKISITLAMIGVIVGEFITSREGLGFVILTAAGRAETDLMMATVVVLCFVGLGFYGLVALGTWLVDRWFGR